MTIFKDQSLEEAIEIMENATASNPSLRVLHEENLSEAMQRRATESGFFPDSRDPLSYQKIEQLRRRADKLHQSDRPLSPVASTSAGCAPSKRTHPRSYGRSERLTGPAAWRND
ncbi:hypothetical protein M2324_002155 [Rhodovulum sulfidophilum]|uniref:hypothetical protein n=1 Tax=Rhodovulum sulfidophilum TaxID=35806 RepID=UPI0012DA291E|nr:hypothetical protein [Rhodovulum sulfidophilum]MCW2303753.1 hypothetical protein [Rhodovulum sulfidophilum]